MKRLDICFLEVSVIGFCESGKRPKGHINTHFMVTKIRERCIKVF